MILVAKTTIASAFSNAVNQKIHYLIVIINWAFVEAHLKLYYHNKNIYDSNKNSGQVDYRLHQKCWCRTARLVILCKSWRMAKENLIRSNKCRWVLTPAFSKLECEVKPDKHHFLSPLPFVNQNVDQITNPHVFMPNRSMKLIDGQTRTNYLLSYSKN